MDNKKKVASILMALTVGGLSGHYIDDLIEKYNLQTDRYPINVEYNIIDKCINNYDEPISERVYKDKRKICICALEKTEINYPYELFREDKNRFLNIFEIKAKECM
ncbi:MAG: hypothetical protein PHY66_08145 [Aliarcobacter sp.]|nr:hypothetical protein [Aliarcobacter sp.]MDD2887760.1 hypothetical protein [Aliarcobacter sp.]